MSLGMTVADNQDGTGAVATITGSDGGQTVTVYTSPFSAGNAPVAWTTSATRTGDGTVSLPVAPNYYWSYAAGTVSSSPAISPPIAFLASRNVDAVHTRFKNAIQAAIQSLTLSGLQTPPGNLTPDRVYSFPTVTEDLVNALTTFPCIMVSDGTAEQYKPVTNARDDIGWPVLVSIIDHVAPQNTGPFPTYYRWREQISRYVRWQRLVGVPEIYTVTIEPASLSRWKPPKFQLFDSTVLFRGWTRDPRGV